jgi:hypothetical protein
VELRQPARVGTDSFAQVPLTRTGIRVSSVQDRAESNPNQVLGQGASLESISPLGTGKDGCEVAAVGAA